MSDARSRFARLVANPRRDAGYTILEAMLPCVGFLLLGTLIAGGFWESGTSGSAGHSSTSGVAPQTQRANPTNPMSDNVGPERPTPASSEQRYVFVTRTYDERLAAAGDRTGTAFHGVPGSDFTGNGNPDILVTKPRATNLVDGTDPTGGFGSVEVWTLWSSAPVTTINGPFQNDMFGLSAKSAGDLDGDGADDLIVGAMLDDGDSGLEGAIHIHSGSDGALLMSIIGEEWEYLGRTVAGASDVDGDGQWDIAASSWVYQNFESYGMVALHSGSDGALIRTFTSDIPNDGFGYEVVSLGDLDGDTRSEIAVSATLAPGDPRAYAPAIGRLHVFDGVPRAASPEHFGTADADLTIYNPDPLIDHFAVAVELTTDEDSDGVADILVTSLIDPYDPSLKTTAMQIFSSTSGDLLWPTSVGGTGSGRDGDQLPSEDENGDPILYSHYTTELGVFGDPTRDLQVEQEDLLLVTETLGDPAEPGNRYLATSRSAGMLISAISTSSCTRWVPQVLCATSRPKRVAW